MLEKNMADFLTDLLKHLFNSIQLLVSNIKPEKIDFKLISSYLSEYFLDFVDSVKVISSFVITVFLFLFLNVEYTNAQVRIKDITSIEGVRDNQLIGYGLVVGLNGTGDNLGSAVFTRESLVGMLERLGVNANRNEINTKNTAAVIVTATLPPFARHGSRIDITVSTLGDSSSLEGGTLIVTPLQGADGEVYAVAQGSIIVGGFNVQGQAQTVISGVPTNGRISNGAIIEKEIPFVFNSLKTANLSLHNPDMISAQNISRAINNYMGMVIATPLDPGTVNLSTPADLTLAVLLAKIEHIPVEIDQPAKVVIDESTGIIVIGSQVRISNVAIAQGGLSVSIRETPIVSQPNPFSDNGQTVVVPRTEILIDDNADNRLAVVPKAITLQELVNGLNSLGVSPRDLISILQSIKAAGALQAEISTL